MQPIKLLYIKLPGGGNRPKPRTRGETAGGIIETEWLRMRPIVKIIVQDYSETSS